MEENSLPPSKKRAAGRELSRDNPGLDDDEESSEQETGTFKRASDEVLASRRIVKVRRNQSSSTPSAPSSNPFAGIRLVSSTDSSSATSGAPAKTESEEKVPEKDDAHREADKSKDEDKAPTEIKTSESAVETVEGEKKPGTVDEEENESADKKATEEDKTEKEDDKDTANATDEKKEKDNGSENVEKGSEAGSLNSFQQLSSSRNAFTGLAGTGFSNSSFSFGSIPKDGSSPASGSLPSFGFSLPNNGASSIFGTSGASAGAKSEGSAFPSMQEVPVETGEENEKAIFTADSVLFEFSEGGWKERGKGELKVNVSTTGTGKARLIMRTRGNYRLILNASLYPDMKLTNMDKKGITFACINSASDGKDGLSTFALKFKDASFVEDFSTAVTEYKGKTAAIMKTPENSPKASDD
ncbi:hypothetical protein NMG60_11002609 [Bertholletia excelsa]